MSSSAPVDLLRVGSALAQLDALALSHPEAFAGRTATEWINILEETEPMHAAEVTTQIAIRLPDSMLAALDAYAAEHAQPGLVLTRSDAIRMLLARALDALKEPSSPRRGR